jgi:hypothetical protein
VEFWRGRSHGDGSHSVGLHGMVRGDGFDVVAMGLTAVGTQYVKKKMKKRQGGKPAIREKSESENLICGLKIVNKRRRFTSFTV